MRRVLAYLITMPLVLVGLLVAHQAGYFLVLGTGAEHRLADTGHGYLADMPNALLACFGTTLLLILIDAIWASRSGRSATTLPTWPFLFVGPLTFAFQEHAERFVHDGQFPWTAALEPTFIVGLALQIPTSLLIYVLARQLISQATSAIATLVQRRKRTSRIPIRIATVGRLLFEFWPPRLAGSILVATDASRAPPCR